MKEVFNRAAELVEDGWERVWLASDADGKPVSPSNQNAVNFCMLGAITKATHGMPNNNYFEILSNLSSYIYDRYGIKSVAALNYKLRDGQEAASILRSVPCA